MSACILLGKEWEDQLPVRHQSRGGKALVEFPDSHR